MADFCVQNPDLARQWSTNSNFIIVLTVPDERALYAFAEKSGLQYTEFREPDLGYALTAIALHPCTKARKKTSNLPLAMKKAEADGARGRENRIKGLAREMEACEQTAGLSVLEHGWSVRNYVTDLLGPRTKFWRLPDWFPKEQSFDQYTLDKYTIFHDCGKPNCRTQDEEGKAHFPDHARISSFVWESVFADPCIGELIARDMEIHTMKAADVPAFCRDPETARLLATVGLAELHSNADMFGGIESQSFKIKYKHWERRAKKVFRTTEEEPCK